MIKRFKNKKSAFTLIELVVAMAVMSVLGAVTVPAVSSYTRKAELSVAKENLRQAHNAVMMVRELGEITTPPQKYAYTDVEDDSEFSALMKKYLNVKYYDRSTGKGTKLIFLNWSKPGKKNEIRIWFELGNGDRVKLKNGNIEGVFESDAPTGMYLKNGVTEPMEIVFTIR